MKVFKLLAVSLAAMTAFSACTKDEVNGTGETSGPTTFTISLNDIASTRNTDIDNGTDNERKLTNLEFYLFKPDGTSDGITPYFKTKEIDKTKHVLQVEGIEHDLTVVVIANSDIGKMATLESLKTEISKHVFTTSNTRVVPENGFEMYGFNTVLIAPGSDQNNVNIALDRLVSKINRPVFNYGSTTFMDLPEDELKRIWGDDTTITNSHIRFTFDGYALINGLDKSTVAFDSWTTWSRTGKSHLNSGFSDIGEYIKNYSGQQDSNWFLSATGDEEPVYVYESMPKKITPVPDQGEGYDAKTVYSFIVKGVLSDIREMEKPVIRYWRVNILKTREFKVERNKSYKITIDKILSGGFETPQDAEDDQPIVPIQGNTYVNVKITVNPWTVVESQDQM